MMSPSMRESRPTLRRKLSVQDNLVAQNTVTERNVPSQPTVAGNNPNELAKIQTTSASEFAVDTLAQKADGQHRTELVTKFVDFSSKYGLGYKLSNGSYGVHFNDATKIILHPNHFHFDYVDRPK